MQENSKLYWKQQSLQQNIMVPTGTIFHPRLDVFRITDVQDISKNVFTGFNQKTPYKDILFV